MIVFLFIAIAFMRHTYMEKDKIRNIAVAYQENQVAIYYALNTEFEKDLKKWDASIDKTTLSFQFNSPEVLFEVGSSEINGKFKIILADFIPRYLKILEKYKLGIDEVRIEGHTSSEWRYDTKKDEAYFHNMELSQGRTRSVLRYAYFLPQLSAAQREWVKSSFAAVGFSSSKITLTSDGGEDKERSRRVTFRVVTNADIQIRRIVEGS
jgi:outer membrane protein OmpA-like peptidoglycan-associated protein